LLIGEADTKKDSNPHSNAKNGDDGPKWITN